MNGQPRLTVVPLTLRAANAYVAARHRHHGPSRGHRFSIGVTRDDTGELVGVAIIGRPIARAYDDGYTAEVNRTCTDGTPNANSALYGAAWRACRAMGYRRLITYTQQGETGASLRGAGFTVIAERPARGSWADSSVALKHLRNPDGAGGVARTLWEVTTT